MASYQCGLIRTQHGKFALYATYSSNVIVESLCCGIVACARAIEIRSSDLELCSLPRHVRLSCTYIQSKPGCVCKGGIPMEAYVSTILCASRGGFCYYQYRLSSTHERVQAHTAPMP